MFPLSRHPTFSRIFRIVNERSKIPKAAFSIGQCRLDKLESKKATKQTQPTFAHLLRNSPLVQLGAPEGKVVIAKIVETIEDDLYVDFGFKFRAVCKRPAQDGIKYVRGSTVKVRINSLELSDRFLGSTQDLTLLEADVTLLGFVSSVASKSESTPTEKKAKLD